MEAVNTTINNGINNGIESNGNKTAALLLADAMAPVKVKIAAKPREHTMDKVNSGSNGIGVKPYNKIKNIAPNKLTIRI